MPGVMPATLPLVRPPRLREGDLIGLINPSGAIHERQRARRTLEGLLAKREKAALIALHQNAQRLLRPLEVLNPYAQFLTFPDIKVGPEKRTAIFEALSLINEQLWLGHFEMWSGSEPC